MNRSPGVADVLAEAGTAYSTGTVPSPVVVGPGEEEPWDFAALVRAVDAHVASMRGAGAPPGTIRPVVVPPDRRGIVEVLASWRAGLTPAPLNPKLTPVERDEAAASMAGRPSRGAQTVLWTSGTSGSPRGVLLSWNAMATHVAAASERLGIQPGQEVFVATLSLAHVGGLMTLVRALLSGGMLVVPPSNSAADLAALLDGESLPPGARAPTRLSLVPTQFLRLLDLWGEAPPPPQLRSVLLGGAHTPAGLLERALAAGWPVALTYGMTEMCSQVATAPPDLVRRFPGTVGPPLSGVDVRIGDGGEIVVRGPTMAEAYLGDYAPGDEAPRDEALRGEEGWYRTGDVGRLDEGGRLWITGRRQDRIVTGGVTVDAREVEEALRAHPAVVDACVAGVPDDEWGERVGAWVVPVEGEFDLASVDEWVRQRLTGAKVPRLWHVSPALPLNANGKVDRIRVRGALAGIVGHG